MCLSEFFTRALEIHHVGHVGAIMLNGFGQRMFNFTVYSGFTPNFNVRDGVTLYFPQNRSAFLFTGVHMNC